MHLVVSYYGYCLLLFVSDAIYASAPIVYAIVLPVPVGDLNMKCLCGFVAYLNLANESN